VRETFSAVADSGKPHLSLAYRQGGLLVWAPADQSNLPLAIHTIRRSCTSMADVFDATTRIVAVVSQRPYMRQVFVP
jgi:hypothetical protein